jgi:alpha-amylase
MTNGVILQSFEWYMPGGTLWRDLAASAASLAAAGFSAVWIPPAYKGSNGGYDVGYAVYDLFDLGEFDQKGSVATKYGTRQQLQNAVTALQGQGLQVYADVVFNHKSGGDATEDVWAQRVDWNDRNRALSDWYQIKTWSYFDFPNRAGQYSTMKWYWWCFDAVSYDQNHPERGSLDLFRLRDKQFSTEVSHENGNYDYLLAADLDLGVEFVRGELAYWGDWFLGMCNLDGFRIDACKHIRTSFFPWWLGDRRRNRGQELFTMGEYWSGDVEELHRYIASTGGCMSLVDVPLHYRFREASLAQSAYDLRTIFDGTLVQQQPALAVTFVDNHDTQPCQSLESWVEPWFKPLAYALILLRREGYPCVFWGDYNPADFRYRDQGREATLYSHRFLIDRFLSARRTHAFGDQHDYFDHPNTIGWIRSGDAAHPGAMAVVMTNGSAGDKWMNTFHPGARFRDATGHLVDEITADASGWANFRCPDRSVSVWLQT